MTGDLEEGKAANTQQQAMAKAGQVCCRLSPVYLFRSSMHVNFSGASAVKVRHPPESEPCFGWAGPKQSPLLAQLLPTGTALLICFLGRAVTVVTLSCLCSNNLLVAVALHRSCSCRVVIGKEMQCCACGSLLQDAIRLVPFPLASINFFWCLCVNDSS